jgi:hypothetical protein
MKMADVLRSLADKLDGIEGSSGQQDTNAKQASDFQHDVDDGAKSGDRDVELTGVMIPPLQAKLEILKKSEGLPNVYDDEGQDDELALMKKRAGISTAQKEASEDNDVLG